MVTAVTKALLKKVYRNFSAGLNSYRAAKYTFLYTNTQGMTLKMIFLKIGQPLILVGGAIGAYYKKKQWDDAAIALHIDVNSSDRRLLMKVFDDIDTDNTGYLSREELQVGLAKSGMNASDFQLDQLMEAADTDLDGKISKVEWIDKLEHHEVLNQDQNQSAYRFPTFFPVQGSKTTTTPAPKAADGKNVR